MTPQQAGVSAEQVQEVFIDLAEYPSAVNWQEKADRLNIFLATASPTTPLTKTLEAHEYRYGGCSCGKFVLPSYSDSDLKKFEQSKPGSDIRWYFWMMHLQGALATAPPEQAPVLVAGASSLEREAAASVALDGDTRRACNNPDCPNDWPCAVHPEPAPPEQAGEQIIEIDEDGKVHGDISGLKPAKPLPMRVQRDLAEAETAQPQAVSDGALTEAGPLSKEDLLALDGLHKTHPNLWRHFRECGQAVLELQKREVARRAASAGALSAEQVLEETATYIALRLPEGLPLRGDRNEAKHVILRLMRAAAPAASKPASEGKTNEQNS